MSAEIGKGTYTNTSFIVLDIKKYNGISDRLTSNLTKSDCLALLDHTTQLLDKIRIESANFNSNIVLLNEKKNIKNLKESAISKLRIYRNNIESLRISLGSGSKSLADLDLSLIKIIHWNYCTFPSNELWLFNSSINFTIDFIHWLSKQSVLLNHFVFTEDEFTCEEHFSNLLGKNFSCRVKKETVSLISKELSEISEPKFIIELSILSKMLVESIQTGHAFLLFNDDW